jgi:hypothetical protein
MKIKQLLSFILKKSSTSNSIEPISSDEILARFIFSSSQFSLLNGVKQAAFLPASDGEASVFRKTKLVQISMYESTKEKISCERGKEIKGVALICAEKVKLAPGLSVEAEESKHKWHANIIGWPLGKNEQKQLALILAQNATLE